jgi:aryl-alcohol dehydrogenase-like predicted oxidoreductase
MKNRLLGKTGLLVSELCFGTMVFGRECNEELSHQLLDRFVEAGGNSFDTADIYVSGVSESILGNWLKNKQRDDFIITTKVYWHMDKSANSHGLSRKHIMSAVEASLRRLQTDYIDIYMPHIWDPNTPLEETLETLDSLVKSGKVRYLGASNFSGWQLQKALDISRQMGWVPFTNLQTLYNLLDREIEWELVPVCLNEGVGITVWSPLRGGWLSGKYRRGMQEPPENTRVKAAAPTNRWGESWKIYANEHTWCVLDALFAVAEETGKTPSQVALNWVLQRPGVTSPIIGARNLDQLEENLGSVGWSLSKEQLERLDQASDKQRPYPYWIWQ